MERFRETLTATKLPIMRSLSGGIDDRWDSLPDAVSLRGAAG